MPLQAIGTTQAPPSPKRFDLEAYPIKPVLPRLLQDKTTHKNILWATNTYEALGAYYAADSQITEDLMSGINADIIQPRIAKGSNEQAQRTKKHAEVFTPSWLCCKMANALDEEWFGRPNVFFEQSSTSWQPTEGKIEFPPSKHKTWQKYVDCRVLEITCGEAPFLASRYDTVTGAPIPIGRRIGVLDRKLRAVSENAQSETEWLKWARRALESVYGFEYQGDNLLIARINILLTFAENLQAHLGRLATKHELTAAANTIAWNLWQMDGLNGTVPCKMPEDNYEQLSLLPPDEPQGQQLSLFGDTAPAPPPQCMIYDWRKRCPVCYQAIAGKENDVMKFDFAIGNPPYQDTMLGDSVKMPPVYNLFMDESYKVADKSELITPARFLFNAGSTPKEWNVKMLNDPHFEVLYYEGDSSVIFSNTDIKGGVAISYYDNTSEHKPVGVFTPYMELNHIAAKVASHSAESGLSKIIYTQNKFNLDKLYQDYPKLKAKIGSDGRDKRFRNNIFEKIPLFSEKKKHSDDINVIGLISNKRVWRYFPYKYMDTQHENLHCWKALVPAANGSGTLGETLSSPLVGRPQTGYTQSFIGIGAFENQGEADACIKYIKSKFARCMLGTLKITQHNPPDTWNNVPLQDFTANSDIDWSVSIADIDKQLYKKYDLTQQEIDFIESHVKEMV